MNPGFPYIDTPFGEYSPVYARPHAPVAQWIAQWIPNPCAASSILAGGTTIEKNTYLRGLYLVRMN